MRLDLLDLLVCPADGGHPLKLSGKVSGVGEREVESGLLTCPVCRRQYPIKKGIPAFVIWENEIVLSAELQDKKMEMEARDFNAERYDKMKALAWLSLWEKPATLKLTALTGRDYVVELGAGTGRFTLDLAASAKLVVGVDLSIDSLLICRRKLKNAGLKADLIQADINHLPLRDTFFDKAVSCQVIEHLPSEQARRRGLSEACRVLKEGGELVISAYRSFWFSSLIGKKEGYHDGRIYYYRFSPREFKNLLSDDFEIVDYRPNIGNYIQLARCRTRSGA